MLLTRIILELYSSQSLPPPTQNFSRWLARCAVARRNNLVDFTHRTGLSHQTRRCGSVSETRAAAMHGTHSVPTRPLARTECSNCPRAQTQPTPSAPQCRGAAQRLRTQVRNRRAEEPQPHASNADVVQGPRTQHEPVLHLDQRTLRTRRIAIRLATASATATGSRRAALLTAIHLPIGRVALGPGRFARRRMPLWRPWSVTSPHAPAIRTLGLRVRHVGGRSQS